MSCNACPTQHAVSSPLFFAGNQDMRALSVPSAAGRTCHNLVELFYSETKQRSGAPSLKNAVNVDARRTVLPKATVFDFGKMIQQGRLRKVMTQAQLAAAVKTPLSDIQRAEQNQFIPSVSVRKLIEKELSIRLYPSA